MDLSASDTEQDGSRKVALFKAPTSTDNAPIHAKHTTFQGIGESGLAHIKGWQILKICHLKVHDAISKVRAQTTPDNNVFVITNGADFLKYAGAFAVSQVKETDASPFFDQDSIIQMQIGTSLFDVKLYAGFKRMRDIYSFSRAQPFLQNPDLAVVLPDNSVYIKTGRALPKSIEESKATGLTTLVLFKFTPSYEVELLAEPVPDPRIVELKKQMNDNGFSERAQLSAKLQQPGTDIYAAFKGVSRTVSERIYYSYTNKADGGKTVTVKKDLPYYSESRLSVVDLVNSYKNYTLYFWFNFRRRRISLKYALCNYSNAARASICWKNGI